MGKNSNNYVQVIQGIKLSNHTSLWQIGYGHIVAVFHTKSDKKYLCHVFSTSFHVFSLDNLALNHLEFHFNLQVETTCPITAALNIIVDLHLWLWY